MRHEIDKLNMVIAPVAAAFGVEYKPGEVRDGGKPGKGKKRTTELDRDDPAMMKRAEQRDAAIFAAAQRAGIPIRDM